jgi:hypothetical protein
MRRTQVVAALVGLVTGLFMLALGPVASAQTGYPPGPCTATVGTLDVGTVTIGQHFVIQVAPTCVFTVGAPVTVTVNGVNIPGKVANASGFVLVDVTVVSATQLSIGDPVTTPAVCGVNTVTASGPSATAQGGVATQTATFTLTCPATVPVASASTPATPIQSRLSLTGANTLRFVAIALALVGTGSMAVVATRRRRRAL